MRTYALLSAVLVAGCEIPLGPTEVPEYVPPQGLQCPSCPVERQPRIVDIVLPAETQGHKGPPIIVD